VSVELLITHRGHDLRGVVRAGESWAAAARRTCASGATDPVPVDLSGQTKRFAIDHDLVVALRPMTRGDLPAVARWRAADHVDRWWHADGPATVEGVTEKYGADIDGTTPTRMWVVEANGRSVGFVQDYVISDHPEFALLTPDPDAIGLDYAIGEPEWVGRGLGTRLVWAWMLRARRRFPDATTYFAAPDHRNEASLRVLDKTGFERGTWFDEPQGDGTTTTMVGCSLDVPRVLG
jgi:RimJ/RimL family protein N-acetyltransferase